MHEAAARDLHTQSHVHFTDFMEAVRHALSNPATAAYLFRSATGYDHDLARLLTPPDMEPPALATPGQAAALLSAGRASGMDDTQVWELALLLGANPVDHGAAVPAMDISEMEGLEEAVKNWGIPHIMMDRWGRLLKRDREDPA